MKSTYSFNIRSPLPVLASGLPAGVKDFQPGENGKPGTLLYSYNQEIPMASYLFALASGDLASASVGPRSTVWTGPEELKASQWEFEKDTEAFIQVRTLAHLPVAGPIPSTRTDAVADRGEARVSLRLDYIQRSGSSS